MEWNVRWDEVTATLYAVQWGTFSLKEQDEFLKDIFEDPNWSIGFRILVDYQHLEVTDIGSPQIESISNIVQNLKRNLEGGKMALVGRSDVQFGLGRQFQMMSEMHVDGEIRVFRYQDEALNWLQKE